MSIYPWGETKPYDQTTFNLADKAGYAGGALIFTEQGHAARAERRAARLGRRRRQPPQAGRPRAPAPASAARRSPP